MKVTELVKGITVYGASSASIDPRYMEDGREVGRCVARAGLPLICGGGRSGLMAAAIDGATQMGGETVGVLPSFMVDRGWQHPQLTRMEITADMHSRKELMATMARGIIALPGGVGTLEELLEIITWRQLGLYVGNIVILNTMGYYDPLIGMLRRSIDERFMNPDHATLWQVTDDPARAVEIASQEVPGEIKFTQKIH